eukprot:TRINITY_DN4132_c0_g1_i1.p2 TRINITY_DN4132_c0_g1~~TRINITY_DN4132_c0_g1_i1.p2  ORF type:complete len:133 (-),score=1.70 TRINITY_DN4132_c0_g1_i1:73-471(-)
MLCQPRESGSTCRMIVQAAIPPILSPPPPPTGAVVVDTNEARRAAIPARAITPATATLLLVQQHVSAGSTAVATTDMAHGICGMRPQEATVIYTTGKHRWNMKEGMLKQPQGGRLGTRGSQTTHVCPGTTVL